LSRKPFRAVVNRHRSCPLVEGKFWRCSRRTSRSIAFAWSGVTPPKPLAEIRNRRRLKQVGDESDHQRAGRRCRAGGHMARRSRLQTLRSISREISVPRQPGVGIGPDLLNKIFDPFLSRRKRRSPTNRGMAAQGLGFPSAAEIIETPSRPHPPRRKPGSAKARPSPSKTAGVDAGRGRRR